jgi:uncharacterized protein
VEFNVLLVISKANLKHPREAFQFLVDNDFHYSQFIPCTEPTGTPRGVSEHSISGEQYGQFMTDLFDAWVENDDPSYYIRSIDNWLHLFFGLPPECCEYREDCSNLITLEWNGDVYPCDFFVESRYRMGNVMEQTLEQMLNGPAFRSFARAAEHVPSMCRDCEWLPYCHAGCFRHRQKLHIEAEGQPYLCEGNKRIFEHVFSTLRTLMKKPVRPELHAFLNRIAREVGAGTIQQRPQPPAPSRPRNGAPEGPRRMPNRNDPCPCGSGKKFKHCCGRKVART